MNISKNGLDLIKKYEGCKLVAYKDPVGIWTIGWGTTNADMSITGTNIRQGLIISQATADAWLEKSINLKYSVTVDKYCKGLNQNQFDALASFTYNCGEGNLKKLVSGRSTSQIAEHITSYNKAGGIVLAGLTRRRNEEKELFLRPINSEQILSIEIIFNANLYSALYEDLKENFKNDINLLKNHFNNFGIKEGRRGSYIFDPRYYLNKYSDLKEAYGNNYVGALEHYITFTGKEGRQASEIFDPVYYLNKYSDLKEAYGNNYIGALIHFLTFGMKEGRQASKEFNVDKYKENYKDLRDNFGNNMELYFNHYLIFGKNEGRKAV